MNLFDFEEPYDPRDQGADRRIVDAKESVEDSWLERPSIHGVGIYRQQDGADVIEVWVDTGADIDSLRLPRAVRDVPVMLRVADAPVLTTSVESAEADAPTRRKTDEAPAPQQDNNRYNPLVGGISICPVPAVGQGIGTLGVVVADPGSGGGAPVLMTAGHVLTALGSPLASPIVQPGISLLGADVIGNGIRGHLGNYLVNPVDQVFVGIDVGVGSTTANGRLSTLNVIAPNVGPLIGVVPPQTGMRVAMRGANTQGTQGMISHINTVFRGTHNGVAVRLDNQFGVEGVPGPFGALGDSGALVLVNTPNGPAAVGMFIGVTLGPPNVGWASPWAAIALYMQNS